MSHGFRFYDAQGNLMIDSSSRSFRSVFRAQVFPIENGRYDLPSTYDDSLGDLFFFTGYRDDGWGWLAPEYTWLPGWKYIIWRSGGSHGGPARHWINVVSTR